MLSENKTLKFLILLSIVILTTISCREDVSPSSGIGKVQISISSDDVNLGGRVKESLQGLLLSIKNAAGDYVYERKQISLFKFGDDYLSEPISLEAGEFSLTEFVVLDENNAALYATPIEGSDLDYLVDDPLPISFSITKDETTKIKPQVISVEEGSAEDFGYTTLTFSIIETFKFYLGVFAYNEASENFELTEANLSISSETETLLEKQTGAITEEITIQDNISEYTIEVTKAGYLTIQKTFTNAQLKEFVDTNSLVISLLDEDITEGLVAYYPFNGNAQDQSGNDLHGTVTGATLTTDRDGAVNAAFSFDGDDYISVADNNLLDFADDDNFSVSLWAWVDPSQTPDGGINDVIRKWSGDAQGYPFGISFNNESAPAGYQKTFLGARYDGSACYHGSIAYTGVVTYSAFQHVVFLKEGSNLKIYVNNQLAGTTTDASTCGTTNNSHMTIGCRGQLARFFKGKIDDIRIYNRALSATEITNLFNE